MKSTPPLTLLAAALLAARALAQPGIPEPPLAPQSVDAVITEDLRREVGDAMRDAQVAVEHAVRMGRDVARSFRFAGGQPRVLVVPERGADARRVAELREDLAVMNRILASSLHGNDEPGRVEWFLPGRGDLDALHLPGTGPVFFLEVGFPLVPPPDQPAAGKPAAETDRVWEEARQEIRGGARPRALWSPGGPAGQTAYNERAVHDVRERLTAALKHARNIRGLRDGERITLVVTGPAAAPTRPTAGAGDVAPSPAAGSSLMTIVATKADVAAIAAGDKPKLDVAFQ